MSPSQFCFNFFNSYYNQLHKNSIYVNLVFIDENKCFISLSLKSFKETSAQWLDYNINNSKNYGPSNAIKILKSYWNGIHAISL